MTANEPEKPTFEQSLSELAQKLNDVLGATLSYEFVQVGDIPLLPSGKLEYAHSEVARRLSAIRTAQN